MSGALPAVARKRRRLWRALAALGLGSTLLLAGAAGLLYLRRERVESWARTRLEAELSRLCGGSVRVGRLALDPFGLEGNLEDVEVRVEAERGGKPFVLSLRSGRVRLAWSGLAALPAGRVHLRALTLQSPVVSLDRAFLEGRGGGAQPQRLALEVDRLLVRDGILHYEDATLPFSIESQDVRVEGEWDRLRRMLVGEIAFSGAWSQPLFRKPVPLQVRSGFRLGSARIDLLGLGIEAPGVRLDLDGHLTLGEDASFAAEGPMSAELEALAPYLAPDFPRSAGRLSGHVRIERAGLPLHVSGRIEAREARFGPLEAARAQADVDYRAGSLRLVGLETSSYGGSVGGLVEVSLEEPRRFSADLEGKGLSVASLLELTGRRLALAGRADLELRLEGEAARLATWNGSGRIAATPAQQAGRVPVSGAAAFELRGGKLEAHAPLLASPSTAFDAKLSLDLAPLPARGDLVLAGKTGDAAATRDELRTILASLGVAWPDTLARPLSGKGTIEARVGIGRGADLDLLLDLGNGSWGEDPFRHARLELGLVGDELEIRSLGVTTDAGQALLAAHIALAPLALLRLDVRAISFPVEPLLRSALPGLPLTGSVTGDVRIEGREKERQGRGHLLLERGRLAGEPYERAEASLELHGSELVLRSVALRGAAGEARGDVRADLDGSVLELALERAEISLASLELVRARNLGLEGQASLHGTILLRAGLVTGSLALEGTGWTLRGLPLGEVAGSLGIEASAIDVDLGPRADRSWHATGKIGLSEPYPVEARLALERAFVALPLGSGPDASWALLSGKAEIAGALADPASLRGTGEIARAEIHLGPVTATNVSPISLRLEHELLEVGPIHVEGRDSDVEASLRYRLGGALEGTCAGRLDLGSIAALWPGLRASGRAVVDLTFSGTLDAPEWKGSCSVHDGRIRSSMFAEALEEIDLEVQFDRREARLTTFSAILGGGEVSGSGRAELRGLEPAHYTLNLALENVRLAYPEGFRGVYAGAVALAGDLDTARLTGKLELVRGVYAREFTQFLGARVAPEPVGTSLGSTTLLLDLEVAGEGNIWVQNEVARIEAAVELHIGGEVKRPELLGRIWALEGGVVRLRDVEYRVLNASLDFVDLERIDPYIDLKAETRVREYDISLSVEGTAEKFRYELTSNPSLSTQDIIALLTTGSTLQEGTGAGPTSGTGITSDMAADYVVGALTGGFERRLKSALGLERVRIDPLLLSDQGDPTARITVGKRVSKDLVLVYSADVGSTEQQIYRAEWEATRKLRVRAERNATGGVGAELGYFTRVGGRRAAAPAPPASTHTAPGGEAPAQRILEIRIEGVPEQEASELVKKIPLAIGSEPRRSSLFAGEEAIRTHYVREGNLEARVESEVVPAAGAGQGVRVVYRVTPGPRVEVQVVGVSGKELRRVERMLSSFWTDSIFSEDLYLEAAESVKNDLRTRGFYAAEAHAEVSGDALRRSVRLVLEPGDPVRVESVRIEGASALGEEEIRRRIETRPGTGVASHVLRADALERDRAAIASLYQSRGFLKATVDRPRVLLSVRGDAADVVFKIDEGPRFTIAAVHAEDRGAVRASEIVAWSGLVVGESFSYSRLLEAENAVRTRLDAEGYPEARVRSRYVLDNDRADLKLEVEPGDKKSVAAISIVGNRRTREKVIRRELLLAPGDPLSRERMIETQQRLYRLGLFQSVRLDYAPIEGQEGESQLLRVRLEEASPILLSLSGGYDTEVGPRATFSVTHANVGGWNRSLSLQGAASDVYRWLQLIAREPRLFNGPLPAIFSLGRSRQEQTGFTEDRRSAALRVEKKLRSDFTSFVRYNYQRVTLEDVEDELAVQEKKLDNVKLGDLGYTLALDRRDDPFMTEEGGYAAAEVRLFAHPLLSESSFTKVFLQGSATHTWKSRNTLAGAVRFGFENPFGATDRVPLPERFFAGGDSTLRGFPRDGVGPKTDEGSPSGGQALLLFNEEWRFPIWRSLKGEVFVDVGNVWNELSELSLRDLRSVAGAGLRLETPIGPIRVEYGRKLDRRQDESRGEFFLSIGSAF